MKYKFIGLPVKYKGKTVWEIVGNLKNFGVGRLLLKDSDSVYPEVSFYKILKVQPLPPKENMLVSTHLLRFKRLVCYVFLYISVA